MTRSVLLCALLLLSTPAAEAQTAALVATFQGFEAARAAHQLDAAQREVDRALGMGPDDGIDALGKAQLCRAFAELAAAAGQPMLAVDYYRRALDLLHGDLGGSHPDLIGLLQPLADALLALKRYAEARDALQQALAIARDTHGDSHDRVVALLERLRAVAAAAGDATGLAEVDAELARIGTQKRGLAGVRDKVVVQSKRYNVKNGFATVRVFYGTNRTVTGSRDASSYYGVESGALQLGYVDVTIPQSHQLAELETPGSWLDYSFAITVSEMRRRYVLLENVAPLDREHFLRELGAQMSAAPSRDLFLFVHGYNNTFEDTARRAAQLVYDLDFDGTPIMYSWPSQGHVYGYPADEKAVAPSAERLAEFLDLVAQRTGAARIHLLAHSMGNRVLIAALESYLRTHAAGASMHRFGQIVFTAPDVDRGEFVAGTAALRNHADRLTLYASERDYALRLSRAYHDQPRAGEAGAKVVTMQGLDTIDMSGLPADVLGHSYFAASDGGVYDLLHLLWRNEPPGAPQRCERDAGRDADGVPLWQFDVEKCRGAELLEAALLIKQHADQAADQILSSVTEQVNALTDPGQRKAAGLILMRMTGLLGVVAGARP